MGKDPDSRYRAVELDASVETIDEAEGRLIKLMTFLAEKGEKKETLFDSQGLIVDDTPKAIITDIDDQVKTYFKNHPEKLYDLEPRKFEELVASILSDLGFDVELTKATRDGGRDIIASIKNSVSSYLTYVECKKYSANHKVGVGIIREVVGVHNSRKPAKSIIVTTSFFTKDAKEEANIFENQLDLKDYSDLKTWLQKY